MGSTYRPTYTDRHGERKQSAVWWIKYYRDGLPIRESSGSVNETDARALLKTREGAAVVPIAGGGLDVIGFIAGLKRQRDKLTAAIEALEAVMAGQTVAAPQQQLEAEPPERHSRKWRPQSGASVRKIAKTVPAMSVAPIPVFDEENRGLERDVVSALCNLGYQRKQAELAVEAVMLRTKVPDTVKELIKDSLALLTSKSANTMRIRTGLGKG